MGGRHQNGSSKFWFLASAFVYVCLASLPVVAQDEIDYTCDPRKDYNELVEICPKSNIQDGKCDNPNHGGGGGDDCIQQDCIDCNYHCMAFKTDCFGCLNAKGCYYCPGDATCQNSDLYKSQNRVLSCNAPEDFWLGGRDNPEDLCIASDSLTQDPLAKANDWAYKMIKVDQVWPNFTGKGIRIRINDDGVDINNPEFEGDGKFDTANSCANFANAANDDHGTRVAGILAGNANNGHCAAGIAYDASLSACNFFGTGAVYSDLIFKLESFDISQNAIQLPACAPGDSFQKDQLDNCPFTVGSPPPFYNPCDEEACDYSRPLSLQCEENVFQHCRENYRNDSACLDFLDVIIGGSCDYDKLPASALTAMQKGVAEGRDGKGAIYIFSSGNSFFKGEDVNMSRWTNSRYTITVGAVGKDGLHADYSTGGAALYVTGPAGDYADVSHIMTTGLGGTCADSGVGTSFSSPIVAGVIALMLEARPELTWRDVQGILAVTSQRKSDPKDTTGKVNAAGIWHSNWYGFGIIDAKKAVDSAQTWQLYTPEYQALGESIEESMFIPNDGTELISEITLSSDYDGFAAESTTVLLDLQHYNRGDLEVTLVSPKGTESILHPGRRPENNNSGEERWKLTTVRNWGEDPTGTWKLKIKDLEPDNTVAAGPNEFVQWKIVVYGQTADGNPPVITTPAPTVTGSAAPTMASAAPTILQTSPPTIEEVSADPSAAPTEEILPDDEEFPTESPEEDGTPGPTRLVTGAPTPPETESPTKAPTVPPTDAPTTSAPVAPTDAPTFVPTPKPTRTPALKTLPPYTYIRPTMIIDPADELEKGPIPIPDRQPIENVGVFQESLPETRPVTSRSSGTGTSSVSASASASQLGATINRPSFVAPPRASTGRNSFRANGEEESETNLLYVEPATNLSIELTGVNTISKALWPRFQVTLETHITSVVSRILPKLHFLSEVHVVYVEEKEQVRNRKKRSLRPDNCLFSVTVFFDERVRYDQISGMENLNATALAMLAFNDLQDREDFVVKVRKEFDELDSVESVSSVKASTEILDVPDSSYREGDESMTSAKDPDSGRGFNGTKIALSVIGAGLLCGILILILRRRM